jgi:penicillin G amidase
MLTEDTQVDSFEQNSATTDFTSTDSFAVSNTADSLGTNALQSYGLDAGIELQTENFTDDEIEVTESFNITGVADSVVIDRDEFGIPHIQADSTTDGVLAQGFVQAQDRLWQMEYRRRFANGTLAEVLGESAVGIDTAIRTWGIGETAQIAYNNLNAESKAIVDAYTEGVNAYLANAEELPTEFTTLGYQPDWWLPTDTIAIAQLQNYLVGTTDGGELTRFELLAQGVTPERIAELLPNDGEGETTILKTEDVAQQEYTTATPDAETIAETEQLETAILEDLVNLFPDIEASNNWVVSGDRTTTGEPFLANDPHLGLENPSAWYQSEISSPELQVIGASLPGIPGIQLGRNENIAWGQTATQVDTEDFYLLEETEEGTGYLYQGEVNDYEIREETIEVKGGETITLEVKESVYGAVVSDVFGIEQPVASKSLGLEPVDGLIEAFTGINQASNWQEFTTSLESVVNPISNFVYADVEGNIGYIAPGNYPIRQPGHTGEYPILGTGEFDWQGFIPDAEIPQLYNPESGYIVTANNRITPDNYPYQINGNFDPGYRAERITELIESKDKLSLEDMQAIQLDRVSLVYRDFQPLIEELTPTSQRAEQWQQRLLEWDGNILPDSQEASVFEAWYVELTRIPSEETGIEFWNEARYLQEAVTPEQAATALEAALARLGTEIPEWGEIHQTSFEPLVPEIATTEPLQVPLGGDLFTVNVSPYSSTDFNSSFGVSYRQIIDFSNLENSVYVTPPGQSADPDSPYYDNQLELWQEGDYIPMTTNNYVVAERTLLNPIISLPETIGEYNVGTSAYYFLDETREETYTENPDDNRELNVRVWYPTEATTGTKAPYFSEALGQILSPLVDPTEDENDIAQVIQALPTNSFLNAPVAESETEYPVLLFSHGLSALPELYTTQAEALASEGYVVVSINHTYDSSLSVFDDGRVIPQDAALTEIATGAIDLTETEVFELIAQAVDIRTEDAQFILDELGDINAGDDPLGLLTGKLNLDKVGILGHSLGGATAAETLALDERFLAGINQDGGLFGRNADASLTQPFMFINADRTNALQEELPFFELQQAFLANLRGDGYKISIAETEHNSFTDLPFLISSLVDAGIPQEEIAGLTNLTEGSQIDPERALDITNDYTTAFFNRYLSDLDSSLLSERVTKYPDVELTTYPVAQTSTNN